VAESPFPVSTVRMPAQSGGGGGGEDSLLPRGFPSEDDLLECETEEEKEELCDKADLIVEKLEAKVGAVQVESSLPISLKAPGFNP
jgi:hypothetical protein